MNKRGYDGETNYPRGGAVDWFTSSDDLDGYPDIERYNHISQPGCSRNHEAGCSRGAGVPLNPAFVGHLESLGGFDGNELRMMRFASADAAYAWYQQQLLSPRKMQRVSAERYDDSHHPVPTVPLTARQKGLLMGYGFEPRELDQMRFFTVREGYNWVGEMINRSMCEDEDDYYESEEEPYSPHGGGDCYDGEAWGNQRPYTSFHDDFHQNEGVRHEEPWPIMNHPPAPLPQQQVNGVVDLTAGGDHGHGARTNIKGDHGGSSGPTCGICFETMGKNTDRPMAAGNCGHVYCRPCLEHAVKQMKKCPTCSKKMYWKTIRNIYLDA